MDVRPIAGTLGAEVVGLDLAQPLLPRTIEAIRAAILEHVVLFFPDQQLTPAEQVRFSRLFGPAGETPFVEPLPDHPEVIAVVKEAHEADAYNFGGIWHSDFSFQAAPPALTFLYAVEVPAYGGDTVFANMYLAYERMPKKLRDRCDGLVGIHTARDAYGPKMQGIHDQLGSMRVKTSTTANRQVEHPLVIKHPETGRPALFFNQGYTKGVAGVDDDAAASLLRALHHHSTHVSFTARYRWQAGSLAMWDNRCSQHYAMNDYGGQRRVMHRTTVAGQQPVAAGRRRRWSVERPAPRAGHGPRQ